MSPQIDWYLHEIERYEQLGFKKENINGGARNYR